MARKEDMMLEEKWLVEDLHYATTGAFTGKTLADFVLEEYGHKDVDLVEINELLPKRGFKPINFNILIDRTYRRNTVNGRWRLEDVEVLHERPAFWNSYTSKDNVAWFRAIGGYERTSDMTHTSISPDKLTKRTMTLVR